MVPSTSEMELSCFQRYSALSHDIGKQKTTTTTTTKNLQYSGQHAIGQKKNELKFMTQFQDASDLVLFNVIVGSFGALVFFFENTIFKTLTPSTVIILFQTTFYIIHVDAPCDTPHKTVLELLNL